MSFRAAACDWQKQKSLRWFRLPPQPGQAYARASGDPIGAARVHRGHLHGLLLLSVDPVGRGHRCRNPRVALPPAAFQPGNAPVTDRRGDTPPVPLGQGVRSRVLTAALGDDRAQLCLPAYGRQLAL